MLVVEVYVLVWVLFGDVEYDVHGVCGFYVVEWACFPEVIIYAELFVDVYLDPEFFFGNAVYGVGECFSLVEASAWPEPFAFGGLVGAFCH